MDNKKLIMVAFHKEIKEKEETIPASIIKIYDDQSKDCFNENYIISSEQVYARKNKKLDYSKLSVDDFKGVKGVKEVFYDQIQIKDYLEMLIDDGFSIRRMTRHNEHLLADKLFSHVMSYERAKTLKHAKMGVLSGI